MTATAKRVRATYPWQRWTNGDGWVAFPNRDYFISLDGFRNTLYSYARAHGLKVYTTPAINGGIYFRFWTDPDV